MRHVNVFFLIGLSMCVLQRYRMGQSHQLPLLCHFNPQQCWTGEEWASARRPSHWWVAHMVTYALTCTHIYTLKVYTCTHTIMHTNMHNPFCVTLRHFLFFGPTPAKPGWRPVVGRPMGLPITAGYDSALIQTRVPVVMLLAMRCSTLDCCATRDFPPHSSLGIHVQVWTLSITLW